LEEFKKKSAVLFFYSFSQFIIMFAEEKVSLIPTIKNFLTHILTKEKPYISVRLSFVIQTK